MLQFARDSDRHQQPLSYQVGRQTVLVGDCIPLLEGIAPHSVDLVVTSPPYNIGVAYNAYNDAGDRQQYLAWMRNVGRFVARVLTIDGSFFLNVAGTPSDPWVAFDVAAAMRETFTLQNTIVWVKSVAINGDTLGHYKPLNSRRFLHRAHEHLFHFTKTGSVPLDRLAVGVPFKDKTNIARFGHKEDRHCAGDAWFIPYQTIKSKSQRFHHPSPFPVELPERCLRLHGKENAVVLDPFAGIGSTLVAAEQNGHSGIGIEIDPVYAEAAVTRLRETVGECPSLL